jgi:hypothetical protein
MMSERDEYMIAMDAFRGLDEPMSRLSESLRSKGSSMPPPAAPRHQPKQFDSEHFWDMDLSESSKHFTMGIASQNRDTLTPISWNYKDEEECEEDDDHLFCGVASPTEMSNGVAPPKDWAKLIQSSQPQVHWDNFMAPPLSRNVSPTKERVPTQGKQQEQVPTKGMQLSTKSRSNPQSSDLLHFACAVHSNTHSKSFDAIEKLALRDPSATHRRMSDYGKIIMQKALIASNKKLSKSVERKSVSWIKPKYTFPLNIAIQYNADPRVLELLVNIAPEVLEMTDGPNMESSLHIAIKHHCPAESIDMMLMAMPSAAATKDRHSNTPLHAACLMRPDEEDLIQNLLLCHPEAADEVNFHAQTPLLLLQRSNQHVSENTLNLMQRGLIAFVSDI